MFYILLTGSAAQN